MRLICTALAAAALLPAAVLAQESRVSFRGYAYDLASNRFIYNELHEQTLVGERWTGGSIAYYAPDGTLIAHKTLDFRADPHVPLYRLELKGRGGYVEGITAVTAERIEMMRQGYGETTPRLKAIQRPSPVTADSGFHVFIRDHFAALVDGGRLPFSFAVASELGSFKFRARRIENGTFEDRPVVRFVIEPDSLLRWLVDPLEISYDPEQRKLLEYRGMSNIHDPATGKAYIVRVIYPSRPPADAAPLPKT